jgi:hypothetical protein
MSDKEMAMNLRDAKGHIVWPWTKGYEVHEYADGTAAGCECYVWIAFLKAELSRLYDYAVDS